ncbi:enoyl-CoA hydratase-related protein [Sphingomonas sp.]|uniref:enoyl-CoA hydratase/isomerase family protein n=1 Tax=Sphingomonas sp. TaxID=28214 RepID=UPI00286C5127|nr:enoyl-CoA hydratase-related protein [Sphingomonas sp.]
MSEQNLLCDVEDGVGRLTLNRPEQGNAIDVALADALMEAAVRLAEDPSAKVVTLTGNGRLFCAGGDIAAFAKGEPGAVIARITVSLHAAINRLATMPKPLICLVNGPAAGAGLGLAMLGDIVLAASSSHFTSAYTAIGVSPDAGTSWLLPRLVGLRRAQDMILTNRRVGPEEAVAMGLATRMVADDALASEGDKLARSLGAGATGALATARLLLHRSYRSSLADQLEAEAAGIVATARSAEAGERFAAFREKS